MLFSWTKFYLVIPFSTDVFCFIDLSERHCRQCDKLASKKRKHTFIRLHIWVMGHTIMSTSEKKKKKGPQYIENSLYQVWATDFTRWSHAKQMSPLANGSGGGGGGGGGYSLYEGYYICSSVSTPLFQVSGKFVEFRPLYFSKHEENVVFWPLYFSKNEENVVFRPLFFIKIGKNV